MPVFGRLNRPFVRGFLFWASLGVDDKVAMTAHLWLDSSMGRCSCALVAVRLRLSGCGGVDCE